MAAKKFYIKERYNPQFGKPYYVTQGQLTKKEAEKMANAHYGENYMLAYENENDYKVAIEKLKANGYNVTIGYSELKRK